MKTKHIILILFLIIFALILPKCINILDYGRQQVRLASLLNVKLLEYRVPDFPYQYFETKLKPGMSVSEIHKIFRGYEVSLACNDWAEVYYYFSSDDEKAFIYMVLYDKGQYISLITQDIYSSTKITVDDCSPGLLKE